MLVADTSAVLAALAHPARAAGTVLGSDGDLHAPHLVDIEVSHALARLIRRGSLDLAAAAAIRADYADLAITRYPHEPFADRIWELRENLSAYDGVFVALSEALGLELVTADRKLARAPGHGAQIRLVDS